MKRILLLLLPIASSVIFNGCSSDDDPTVPPPAFNNTDEITAGAYTEVGLSVSHYDSKYKVTIDGVVIPGVTSSGSGDYYEVKFKVPFQAKSGNIQIQTDDGTAISGPKFTYKSRYFAGYTDINMGNALTAYGDGMMVWKRSEETFYEMKASGMQPVNGQQHLMVSYVKHTVTLPDNSNPVWYSEKLMGVGITDDHDILFYNVYDATDWNNQMLHVNLSSGQAAYATGLPDSDFGIITDIEADATGQNIFLVDEGKPYIKKVVNRTDMSILAGAEIPGQSDGQGTTAGFESITAIAIDKTRNVLYVADKNRIRQVTFSGAVTTLAGSTTAGDKDGNLTEARFSNIKSLALASDGTLYILDNDNGKIKTIDPAHTGVSTLPDVLAGGPGSDIAFIHMVIDPHGIIYMLAADGMAQIAAYIPESFVSEAVFKDLLKTETNGGRPDLILTEN